MQLNRASRQPFRLFSIHFFSVLCFVMSATPIGRLHLTLEKRRRQRRDLFSSGPVHGAFFAFFALPLFVSIHALHVAESGVIGGLLVQLCHMLQRQRHVPAQY